MMKIKAFHSFKYCLLLAIFSLVNTFCYGDIVINEIHFDPEPNTEEVEFIELYNTGGSTVDGVSVLRYRSKLTISNAPGGKNFLRVKLSQAP